MNNRYETKWLERTDRITVQDLDEEIGMINRLIGNFHTYKKHTGKGYRFYRNNGSKELSPIVSKKQLYAILKAYSMGLWQAKYDLIEFTNIVHEDKF